MTFREHRLLARFDSTFDQPPAYFHGEKVVLPVDGSLDECHDLRPRHLAVNRQRDLRGERCDHRERCQSSRSRPRYRTVGAKPATDAAEHENLTIERVECAQPKSPCWSNSPTLRSPP